MQEKNAYRFVLLSKPVIAHCLWAIGSGEHSKGALEGAKAFWEGTNLPFPKMQPSRDSSAEDSEMHAQLDFPFVSERTFDASTPRGELSAAVISCIEQFSRYEVDFCGNGLCFPDVSLRDN